MNMYSLLQSNPTPTQQEIESLFDGNICRCTGMYVNCLVACVCWMSVWFDIVAYASMSMDAKAATFDAFLTLMTVVRVPADFGCDANVCCG